jgi:hypothetical protein
MSAEDICADIPAEADPATKARLRWFRISLVLFPIFSIGGAFLLKWLELGWVGVAVFVVLMMGMATLLMRNVQALGRQMGCGSPAITRYNRRMLWGSVLYMIGLFVAVWCYRHGGVSGVLLWGVALLPAAAVLGMVWAMGRLVIEETDEYLRFRLVKQALFACGGLLAVSTVWGFLEQFELVVHVPAWASVPVFAVMLGVGQCFRWVRT